ncbi:MAG TPA: hypothetical protein VEZ90_20035 [Blastocatellia bacterium]|nr:hypothetical protein [Blastocatellia bacterium]
MFCSNCGATYTEAPPYCKSCGLSLRRTDLEAARERFSRQGLKAGVAVFALLLGAQWTVELTSGHPNSDPWGLLTIFLTMVFVWMVTVVFVNPWTWGRRDKALRRERMDPGHDASTRTLAELPPTSDAVSVLPSVTEETTRVLVRESDANERGGD